MPLIVTTRSAQSPLPPGARFVRAVRVTPDPGGLLIEVESSWGKAQLPVRLVGEFNVDNALTVLAVLLAWHIPLAEAVRGARQVPRGQRAHGDVRRPRAHAACDRRLRAHPRCARERAACRAPALPRALRVVFGCGGDRDAGKRPLMGRIAAELADDIIVTDDNPRSEDPARIVADIIAGMTRGTPHVVEHDRALAIRLALERSAAEDVVLIAGKGHEGYQIVGTSGAYSSDRPMVSRELARLPA